MEGQRRRDRGRGRVAATASGGEQRPPCSGWVSGCSRRGSRCARRWPGGRQAPQEEAERRDLEATRRPRPRVSATPAPRQSVRVIDNDATPRPGRGARDHRCRSRHTVGCYPPWRECRSGSASPTDLGLGARIPSLPRPAATGRRSPHTQCVRTACRLSGAGHTPPWRRDSVRWRVCGRRGERRPRVPSALMPAQRDLRGLPWPASSPTSQRP